MFKKAILAVVAAFFAWSVLDFILHGLILQSTYEATPELWRPMEEMNMPLMYLVTLIYTTGFVAIYTCLITEKSVLSGLKFGALFGIVTGIGMGFGSYSYMPIPLCLAWGWFLGSIVESIIAGVIVGAIVKPANESA